MNLKPWLLATVIAALLAIGALIGQWYVLPPPTLVIEFKENSCAIRCPAHTAYPNMQGSITCPVGSAPRCQCMVQQEPIAGCVPAP